MRISYNQLVAMLGEAYDLGVDGSCDLKDQAVDEVIAKASKPQELRVYTVAELRNLPIGSRFCHTVLGYGEIVAKNGVKSAFMQFASGVNQAFVKDEFPWSVPMLRLE